MLGISLLFLAAFIPSLYGMEAMDCGFDDTVLEVKQSNGNVRSGWNRSKYYDWSANKVRGRITVPYRFVKSDYQTKLYPSWYTEEAVKSAFRYIEEHVGCIEFEWKETDKKSLLINIGAETRCWNGIYGSVGINDNLNDINLHMDRAPCDRGWDKDSIEYIDKPLYTCREWIHTWKGSYCNRPHHWPNSPWFNTFVHEVFHAFGIAHTMTRTDRDSYIKLSNHTSYDPLFAKIDLIPMAGGGQIPYECNSIMHYKPRFGNFKAVDPSTCKFESVGPTDNDWKAVKYKVCGN